jgi:putative transposase
MTFAFIDAEKAVYPVRRLCRALAVSPSGYYAWRGRGPSVRAQTDDRLRQRLRVAHAENHRCYGSPRLHQLLRQTGVRVSRKRVVRLMRADGLYARRRRRFRLTTDSTHQLRVAPNHLGRAFAVPAPDRVWVADITYLDTAEGWTYLAVVIDLYARCVVGWAVRPTLASELTCAALHLALGRRQPRAGVVHHSDRGLQYASAPYQQLLHAHGMRCSMSRKGDCYDNAVAESFFSTLKTELATPRWSSHVAAYRAVAAYIDQFYNPRRLHSSAGYRSPLEAEAAYRARV